MTTGHKDSRSRAGIKERFGTPVANSAVAAVLAATIALIATTGEAIAGDFRRNVVYQVFTDRFYNGDTGNDDPQVSKGMFDPEKKDWHAYWGGDLAGVTQKLDYIQKLGATAIWISPCVDNIDKPSVDDQGKPNSPYHGYHTRDFRKIDEHFGDKDKSWKPFDELVKQAHKRGIKIIVDYPFNHTSSTNSGEYGNLYDRGQFKCDPQYTRRDYFHNLPSVKDWNDRFQIQYGTVWNLADLNQQDPFIDHYLKTAAFEFQSHGADACRLDAAKHITWGWEYTLANALFQRGEHQVFGEWWLNGTEEPLFRDAAKFANRSGIALFDFPFALAVRDLFAADGKQDFTRFQTTLEKEEKSFDDTNEMLTFIDNHDMPRFLNICPDREKLHLALTLLLTSRGTPVIYYGTEQYLVEKTDGGKDPYDRQWMSSFDESGDAFALIERLSALRKEQPVFAYGKQAVLDAKKDSLVFERSFAGQVALAAINKGDHGLCLDSFKTSLPAGHYDNAMDGLAGGSSAGLDVGKDGRATLRVPAGKAALWYVKEGQTRRNPVIGSISPRVASGGTVIRLRGTGFGDDAGQVEVGDKDAEIRSWTDREIEFVAPHGISGEKQVRVRTVLNLTRSQPVKLGLESRALTPVCLRFKPAPALQAGEQLFISGDTYILGEGDKSWSKAAGPLLLSAERDYILSLGLPAGKEISFKLIVLDKDGNVAREEKEAHRYKVPTDSSWEKTFAPGEFHVPTRH